MGTPKETTDTGADDTARKDEEELTGEEKELLTNVYGRLRTELVNRGVPTEQVAFIHDHDTPVAREEILAKVRNGDVRVLIGSTQKIGVGINVEDHAAAAHHIDVPWRPRDVEQREGRVIRQGNKIYGPERDDDGKIIGPGRGVQVYQYVQAQSFDRFMWQAVEEKARGIKALMKRNQTHREMEDVDPLVIGASEAKALASGDPLAIRAEELRQKVDVGRLSRAAHKRRQFEAESQKRTLAPQIEAYEKSLPALQADAERVEALPEKADFTIQVGDRTFEKRADAGVALADLYGQVVREYKSQGHIPIGKYKGFDVAMNTDKGYQLTVVHPETQYPHEGSVLESDEVTPRGLMSRLDNLVRGLPARADKMQSNLDRAKENSRLYDDQLGKQYEGGAELDHGERQLRVIRAKLADDSTLLREGDDPDMDVQSDFAAAASIAVPAKAPAETPREIPDADPVDVRQAVEIARGEDQADTPREVASVLKEQIESPAAQARPLRPDAERRLAERKVMEAQDGEDEAAPQTDPAPTGSQELPGSADAPAPEAAAAASVTAPDSAEPTELKAPLSELDELAQEYNFGAYSSLNADLSAVILGLWRARNNVSDSTKVVPETPAAERPRVAITDVSLPLEDERPKPKAPAERLAEVEASDAYQETQKDENLMRAYMPEERDAVRESLSLKKEIREEKDQEELPDAEFQELREKALDATYRNELHLGKSEEQAREHMEYMRGLYQKNEGDVTRRRFEATIARSPDADTVKLKSVLDDVNKNRVRAKEEAAKYPELDGKVTLGELDAAIFSLHGANRSVKGRVGAGVSEDTPVSLVDAYQYGVLPDDAGLTGAQLREAFREAKIKAATPAKKTDIIADKDGIDRLVSMIPEQGVIDVDYLRRESGLGDAFDETLEAAKRRGNVALTDEGSGVMSVEWRDRHEERAPKPAAMTKPEAQAVKPKEEAVKTPAEDYMAVSREIEEVGGTPPKFKVSMKDLEAIRDDYKRMPPPTATASEMIEAAKDGPVALTGPGSIMNKLAEEEAAKRKRSIPSAARASATEVSDAADVLFGKLQADRAFQNALRHSDSQNAQIEYNNAMLRAVDRLLADGPMDLYKKLVDSPEFRERLDYHLRTRGIFNKPQDDKRAAEVKEKPPAPATPEPSVAIEPEQSAAPPPSGPMFWSDIQGEPKSKTQGQLWARDKERRQVVLDRLNGVEGDFFANAPFNAVEEERAKELFDKEREIIRTGHYGTWKDESRALQSARISMAERAKERQSPPEVPTRSDENWRERERQGELKELERIAVRADTQEERDFWQGVMHDVRTRDKRGPETQRVGEDYVKEELLRLGAYRAEMEGADLLREGEEPWQAAERVHADLAERRRAGAPPKPKDVQEAPPADTPKRERGEQRAEETPVTGDQVIERIRKERQESDATIKAAAKRQMDANEVVAASRALDRALETRHKASGASERKEAHAAVEEARSEYWETVAEAKGKREREKAARKEEPTPAPEPSAIEWEYHDKLAQVKKHTFQPNPGMKYDISEQGKYWRNTLWVEHPKGKTAMTPSGMTMGYYPPGDNRYESAEEAQAAAEKHYREWEASGEPAPRNQKFAGGGLFGGKKMSLEEMAESDVEAAKAKKNREKRDSRNEAARARRAAARPQKLVETWQEGPMSSEKADYDRNLAVLKRIPEDVFPLGEKTRIVGIWETAGDRFGAAPTAAEAPSKPKDVQESEPTPAKRERKPKGTPSAETAPAALAPEPVAETPAKPKKPTRKETAAAWVGKQKTPEAAAQKVQAHIAKLMQKEHLPQRQLQPWLDRQEAAQEAVSASKPEQKADVVPEQPKRQPASSVSVEGEPLYQGHKGPGIGYLKDVVPERRDGDGDTVVAERRPRKADEFKKSPEPVPAGLSDKYRKIGSELTSRATAAKRGKGRRRRSKAAAPKLDSPQRPPSLKIVTR